MDDKKNTNPAVWRLERELKRAAEAKEKLEMIFEKDKQRYEERLLKVKYSLFGFDKWEEGNVAGGRSTIVGMRGKEENNGWQRK